MIAYFDGWTLKSIRCHCCSAQATLVFVACTACDHVTLICDEVGTVYFNPTDLEAAVYGGVSADLRCPICNCEYLRFTPASKSNVAVTGYSDESIEFRSGVIDPRSHE